MKGFFELITFKKPVLTLLTGLGLGIMVLFQSCGSQFAPEAGLGAAGQGFLNSMQVPPGDSEAFAFQFDEANNLHFDAQFVAQIATQGFYQVKTKIYLVALDGSDLHYNYQLQLTDANGTLLCPRNEGELEEKSIEYVCAVKPVGKNLVVAFTINTAQGPKSFSKTIDFESKIIP